MGARSSKPSKTIAVCGATGQQGGATVDALLALNKGHTVRALTRDPTSAKSLALASRAGVEVVKADFDDPTSLLAAFQGCDAVFAVTDFWKACALDPVKELQQGKNLVDAAKTAGVSHFVNSTLEDTRPVVGSTLEPVTGPYVVPHFDAKAEADAYAREQLPGKVTSVYTSVFYENLSPGSGMDPQKLVDGSFSLFLPGGDTVLPWCSTEDIGGVAASVLDAGPKKWGGKSVGVVGELATIDQVAATMGKVTGNNVVVAVKPSPEEWAAAVMGFGVPQLVAKDLSNMFAYYIHPEGNKQLLALRPLKGTKSLYKGTQSMEAWMEKNKEKFVEGMK